MPLQCVSQRSANPCASLPSEGMPPQQRLGHRLWRRASQLRLLLTTVLLIVPQNPANTAKVEGGEPVNRLGRLFGYGYSDGYHAPVRGKVVVIHDLPPRSQWNTWGHVRSAAPLHVSTTTPSTPHPQMISPAERSPSDALRDRGTIGSESSLAPAVPWPNPPPSNSPAPQRKEPALQRPSESIPRGPSAPSPAFPLSAPSVLIPQTPVSPPASESIDPPSPPLNLTNPPAAAPSVPPVPTAPTVPNVPAVPPLPPEPPVAPVAPGPQAPQSAPPQRGELLLPEGTTDELETRGDPLNEWNSASAAPRKLPHPLPPVHSPRLVQDRWRPGSEPLVPHVIRLDQLGPLRSPDHATSSEGSPRAW